jgi:peptidoglycan/xylan/chitin deacetylase (PgdA/CDA1 family)
MNLQTAKPDRWMPVLMYHRVVDRVDGPDPWHLQISAAHFAAQLAYLHRRGYQAVALDDVPAVLGGTSPWKKPVAISFDDGYLDTYTHAFPLLKKYRFTATVMLVSQHIGGHNAWDSERVNPVPLLAEREIRELARAGIHFGAHGATHAALTELTGLEARRELERSKAAVAALVGHEITTLAYPFGQSNAEICRIARDAGYRVAFGTDHGERTLLNFSRIDSAAYRGDTLLWRLKVRGLYDALRRRRGVKSLNDLRKRILSRPGCPVPRTLAENSC